MPPFNFGQAIGQAFQRSFENAQNRQQKRKQQRAMQRFRMRRLQQQAEQARKRREAQDRRLDKRIDAQNKRARQGTIEVNRGNLDALPGEGTVRMDADNVAQLRGASNRTIDVPRPRLGLDGEGTVEMTPGQFANFRATEIRQNSRRPQTVTIPGSNFADGQARKVRQSSEIGQRYLMSKMKGANQGGEVPEITLDASGRPQTGPTPENEIPEGQVFPDEKPSFSEPGQRALYELEEFARTPFDMFAKPTEAVANLFRDNATQDIRSTARGRVEQAAQRINEFRDSSPKKRASAFSQIDQILAQTDKKLATYEQTEDLQKLRQDINTIRRVARSGLPRSSKPNKQREALLNMRGQMIEDFNSADDPAERRKIFDQLRKTFPETSGN